MRYSFDINHRVEYVETDAMAVVHNSNYFLFFEKGRIETMRSLNIPYKEVEERGILMPLVEQYCKYIYPARYDDILIIRTTINELPCSKICFNYEIFKSEDNGTQILLVKGYNILAFVDRITNRPTRCPRWIKEKINQKLGD